MARSDHTADEDSEPDVKQRRTRKKVNYALDSDSESDTDVKPGLKRKLVKDEDVSFVLSSDEDSVFKPPSKRQKTAPAARKRKSEAGDVKPRVSRKKVTQSVDSGSEPDAATKPIKKEKFIEDESAFCIISSDEDSTSVLPSQKKLKTSPTASKVKKEPKTPTLKVSKVKKEPKPATSRQKQKPKVKTKEPNEGDAEETEPDGACASSEKTVAQTKKTGPKPNSQASSHLWDPAQEIAAQLNLDMNVAFTITRLFDNGNTIPFLARYRRNLIGDCDAEKLRAVKALHEYLKQVQVRAAAVVKQIEKKNKLAPETKHTILNARSLEEVEFLYSPYKSDGKCTKAEKAKRLGLEPLATAVLEGSPSVNYDYLKNFIKPGLSTSKEVLEGAQHIIADVISKNKFILDELRMLQDRSRIFIQCAETKKSTKDNDKKGKGKNDEKERSKYQNFFNFNCDVKYVKSHQILAINRAEHSKFLSVKIVLPDDFLLNRLFRVCENLWLRSWPGNSLGRDLIQESFKDAYNRLIAPFLKRCVRSQLNLKAQQAAVDVFAVNLKNLLLTPPLKGKRILAVDPGFTHGCKFAFIDTTGTVLHLETLYLSNRNGKQMLHDSDTRKLRNLMVEFNCDTIALGNGKGCREVEAQLSELIGKGFFSPELDVSYTIVNEQGASIYSVSEEAKEEFPDTDPNLVSAVSIGRRLQDPLSELVKIEPKHLGVGMYQLDVNDKLLESTLNEIVVECVSFVGVDVNTASIAVLRKLAGLNQARASEIIEWRKRNGTFTNRCLLKHVKGIGDKTFEQCAGFIRIIPQTAKAERPDPVVWNAMLKGYDKELNPLDQTQIHPESYPVVHKLCRQFNLDLKNLGTDDFVRKVNAAVSKINIKDTAEVLGIDIKTMEVIISGLTIPLNHDLRAEFSKPLFKKGLMSIADITPGVTLTGRVDNVTSFGAFVDIGVNTNGLIHISKFRGLTPELGNRVEVQVEYVEVERKRISLILLRII